MMRVENGALINQYKIISAIGKGGMGEVYLAEDTRLDRKVALKLLPAQFTQNTDRVRRFVQEAKAASALNHPNIITVYDIGETEAGRFIVMEMVKGRTLRAVIAEDNTVETLLALGSQMAKALGAAHAAGITHRDIKPDNIMVREDSYVKLLDFGLARLLPAASGEDAATLAQQTTPGTIMGTVAYMSPEQAGGQSVSPQSDIFALGIVLYELLTGQHPFRAETLVGYLHAITLQTPPPPSQLKPGIPVALDALILRMLEKDASRRPIAGEVAQALQEMERRGETANLRRGDGETRILPTADTGATRADEGFWVAVLPIRWRGANADLEALAEGLSEEIVTGLSRFSYLRVIARSSAMRFMSEASDIRSVGKQLGVRYVMEGSIRQAGATVRLAVQLVEATTGAHLWAETFDRHFQPDQIFALQDELIPRIVSTCGDHFGVLARSISEAVRWKDPTQLSPYEALMRGFGYHHRLTASEHAEAREVLERAVEQAPGNADCWAMLSWVYAHEYGHGFNPQPGSLDRALAAARRAVDLAPSNHLAYQTLAVALFFRKETAGCLSAAERAMALNPLDASNEAIFLITFTGDWERGCSLIRRAMELNPHHPGWYRWVLAVNEYRKTNYRAAVDEAIKANAPGIFWTSMLVAAAYGQLGELGAARDALRNLLAQKEGFVESAREVLGKWFEPELVEQLIDGLRKAGLEIADQQRPATPQRAVASSGTGVSPVEPEKKQSAIRQTASTTPSIAVLPFTNTSPDEENEYFCDGLAEELLNALSKIEALRVAARTSAFSFKGKETDIREIGRKLNVSVVLEGSVRKAGNRLRITAQLISVADGYHLWSERYDRELQDIFDIQDEISLAIVEALKVKLLGVEKAAVLKHYTENTEAYELYLKGRFFWGKVSPSGFEKAIEYFNKAILIEPTFALAYAGLADSYAILSQVSAVPVRETMPKAREFARKALSLDEALAEAHTSLGLVLMDYDYDFVGAEAHFKNAIKLNPNNSTSHQLYGQLLAELGRHEEADAEFRQALKVDPLSVFINCLYGFGMFEARRYDEAIVQLGKALELDSSFPLTQLILAYIHQVKSDYSESVEGFAKFYELVGNSRDAERVRKSFADGGWSGFVRLMTGEQPPADVTGYLAATLYSSVGEKEAAFDELEKAYENREALLALIKIDPRIDCLRDEPRFADSLGRIGL